MRLTRVSLAAVALAGLAGACNHDGPTTIVTRDGTSTIPVIDMGVSTSGFLGGTRAVNRFIVAGAFDTSVADAFGRSSSGMAGFYLDANCYGDTLISPSVGPNSSATYQSPNVYLPALAYQVTMEDACGG